jgi:hypothetical protein
VVRAFRRDLGEMRPAEGAQGWGWLREVPAIPAMCWTKRSGSVPKFGDALSSISFFLFD